MLNGVFDSLTGEDETPIHGLPARPGRDARGQRRGRDLRFRWHWHGGVNFTHGAKLSSNSSAGKGWFPAALEIGRMMELLLLICESEAHW